MKNIFSKNRKETQTIEAVRIPQTLPAKCLGEKCVNFIGVECNAYEDLLKADGQSGGRDLPPFRSDATFVLYGRVCTGGTSEVLVATRAETYKDVNPMMLVAQAGRYGDIPLTIQNHAQQPSEQPL